MNNLLELGYAEVKPLLYMKEVEGGIALYHDYRKGYRWSYAFKDGLKVDVTKIREYQEIKAFEEAAKCETLDKF